MRGNGRHFRGVIVCGPTFLWSVVNTHSGQRVAAGEEFTHTAAMTECAAAVDAIRLAAFYLTKLPKVLR